MSHCFTCGGNGFEDKVCPECRREPASFNIVQNNSEEFVRLAGTIDVPQQYMGIEWNKSILLKTHQDRMSDGLFMKFADQLEKIHNIFASKKLPAKSAIIVAPPGYSKQTFAYSCMQFALTNGFTVAPLLDTVELKRMLILSSENPKYKLYNSIDYDNYVLSDILFISVTKTYYKADAYSVIEEIKDRRARKGLPTIVLSRHGIDSISEWDRSNHFKKMIMTQYVNNDLKYPAIISYLEGLNL